MKKYYCAAAIITAVEIELEGVLRLYSNWKSLQFEDDAQIYYETVFPRGESHYRLIAVRQQEMGMTAAASLSHKLIERFRPAYLVMTGIAAGIGAQQLYGDVIAADTVWNCASGKFVSAEKAGICYGSVGFLPRPSALGISSRAKSGIRAAAASPENEFHVHIAPIACGSSVVSSSEVVRKQVLSQFPETGGLDMESYGVFYAAQNACPPKPDPIVIKSICDYADEEKCDLYQKFAAYTSSEFAKLLYEKFLPLESVDEAAVRRNAQDAGQR